ncbi:MAG: M1 family aminopeptidase [Terriglobia bacterium]
MKAPHSSFVSALLLASLLVGAHCARAQSPDPRTLLDELRQVGLDEARSYRVTDLLLHRDAIRLRLRHGTLMFLKPVAGRITGAVFEGTGEVLVLPPDRGERQQLVKFIGSPILTESFDRAYFRFTDSSFAELFKQIRAGHGRPVPAPQVRERWQDSLETLNSSHAVRLLLDFLQSPPLPYFYAGIYGQHVGTFDIVVDHRRREEILVGQLVTVGERHYYDVWCSFQRRGLERPLPAVKATAYRIEATLTAERELKARSEVDLELPRAGEHVLLFDLSRFLTVEEVVELVGPPGEHTPRPLAFFQNATMTAEEAIFKGTDVVVVVLPPPLSPAGLSGLERRRLRFRYRGRVILDVGGGVLYVGARGIWYPAPTRPGPAHFEMRFRYPHSLELVATGTLRETHTEGEQKESSWVTEVPLPVAGFNVGHYDHYEVRRDGVPITVYANRQLEPYLARAGQVLLPRLPPPTVPPGPYRPDAPGPTHVVIPPAAPIEQLERVANLVADALDSFSKLFGPFPYPNLKVSQIPARLGQGFPGLLYLSTLSFLPEADLARMGLDERSREFYTRLTPAHEAAHQWWGSHVQFPHYRDQWLAESLAAYSALLYLEQQPGGQAKVRQWLERYRQDLLRQDERGTTIEPTGALTLGIRLNSSLSPHGYASLIYSKGPWVLHMLRTLFRDSDSGSDAVFFNALRALAARQRDGTMTTADFQRHFEQALPSDADLEDSGRLDWFFQQWVYDTGVPRYQLHWKARPNPEGGWHVQGRVTQSGVSGLFTMPLPLYARFGEQLTRLGRVIVTGEQVTFRFPAAARPDEVMLDPHLTVLSVPE